MIKKTSTSLFAFRFSLFALLVLACASFRCTESPVGGDNEASEPNLALRGIVALSNGDDPQNAYIWFDALNASLRPGPLGAFEFTLPPPAAQTQSGGLEGAYSVNLFISNFNFVSRTVIIVNGSLQYGAADLDEDGDLFPPPFLNEQLRIRTEVQPKQVELDGGSVSFDVTVFLHAFKDTVDIFFPRKVDNLTAPLLLRNLQNDAVTIVSSSVTNIDTTDFKRITTSLVTREMRVTLPSQDISPGEYEVVPYLLVSHDDVPEGLLQTLGENVQDLGPDYLDLPFVRREGRLEIVADPGADP